MSGQLQAQLKQSKPFRSPHEELHLNLLRTAAALQTHMTALLREHDLSSPQYNVLRILRGAGAAGLACSEIGERMVTRDPDVTRALDRMEARGLVARERSTTDRRVVIARLTPTGREVVDALDEPVAAVQQRRLGHLTDEEVRTLNALLERTRAES